MRRGSRRKGADMRDAQRAKLLEALNAPTIRERAQAIEGVVNEALEEERTIHLNEARRLRATIRQLGLFLTFFQRETKPYRRPRRNSASAAVGAGGRSLRLLEKAA